MGKEHKEKKEKKSSKAEKVEKVEKKVVDASNDSDMETDAPARVIDISPIAVPLAADKLTKKLLKTVKKGNSLML